MEVDDNGSPIPTPPSSGYVTFMFLTLIIRKLLLCAN